MEIEARRMTDFLPDVSGVVEAEDKLLAAVRKVIKENPGKHTELEEALENYAHAFVNATASVVRRHTDQKDTGSGK